MKLVAVDNRVAELEELTAMLRAVFPDSTVEKFTDPLLSAKYICNNFVDMVFVEAKMRPADGLTLLAVLRRQKPELPIIMMSDAEGEHISALQAADDYLVRPITVENLNRVVEML